MSSVRCRSYGAGQEHYTGLLGGHIYAAGSTFVTSQVTFTESAETAEIAIRQVEGFVAFKKSKIPISQSSERREWRGTHGLRPRIVDNFSDGYFEVLNQANVGLHFVDFYLHIFTSQSLTSAKVSRA
jgi:hypothetical protein